MLDSELFQLVLSGRLTLEEFQLHLDHIRDVAYEAGFDYAEFLAEQEECSSLLS